MTNIHTPTLNVFTLLSRRDALFTAYLVAHAESPISTIEILEKVRERHRRSDRAVRAWLRRLYLAGLVDRRFRRIPGGFFYYRTGRLRTLLQAASVNEGVFSPEASYLRPADPSKYKTMPPSFCRPKTPTHPPTDPLSDDGWGDAL